MLRNINYKLVIIIFISTILIFTFAQRKYKSFQKRYYKLNSQIEKLERSSDGSWTAHPNYLEHIYLLNNVSRSTLIKGEEEISKHQVVICGISRDNAKDLPVMINHIENLGMKFKDYRVVIFENDSKDGTKEILNSWQNSNQKVHIISQNYNNEKRPSIKFLAESRNRYLEELRTNPEYKEFDILMVVDMDMMYGFDTRGIESSFSLFDKWDGVCSNGISNHEGNMYDAFAFRSEEFPWKPIDDSEKYWKNYVPLIQKVHKMTSGLVPVYSCFGGLAFYKMEYVKDCKYDSIEGDCEHVLFHECLRNNNGRMFMNPVQIIRYSHFN